MISEAHPFHYMTSLHIAWTTTEEIFFFVRRHLNGGKLSKEYLTRCTRNMHRFFLSPLSRSFYLAIPVYCAIVDDKFLHGQSIIAFYFAYSQKGISIYCARCTRTMPHAFIHNYTCTNRDLLRKGNFTLLQVSKCLSNCCAPATEASGSSSSISYTSFQHHNHPKRNVIVLHFIR